MLNRILWRDVWHLRGQLVAAALVAACGIAALIGTRGTYDSLLSAREDYYRAHQFADIFVHLVRAPDRLTEDLRALPGVARVQSRIVVDVSLDLPNLPEPAVGRLVSLPDDNTNDLNTVHIVKGSTIAPGSTGQVLISEAFANANQLKVGDTFAALLNGRRQSLVITGTALSPEFLYEVGSGMLYPDNKRFGVIWMERSAMAPIFNMRGAFNDIALSLTSQGHQLDTVAALDALLRPYGGHGAFGRDEQMSHRILADELGELRVQTTTIPALFLGVTAFLLYLVLARLVATQRAQIGLLKAFGRSDLRLALHYLNFAFVTVGFGFAIGLPLGAAFGTKFIAVYREFFHFPDLRLSINPSTVLFALCVCVAAACAGALLSAMKVVALNPSEAMRPEPPAPFHSNFLQKTLLQKYLSVSSRMVLRNILRMPWKAFFSMLGIALAIGLMVLGRFAIDGVNFMMDVQFTSLQREDVTVIFNEPSPPEALLAIARLDAVQEVEAFRILPAMLRSDHHSKRVAVTGLSAATGMRQLLNRERQPVALPHQGLMLNDKLARILGVVPGDAITIESLEGRRLIVRVPVAGITEEMIGLGAYMDAAALARLLQEAPIYTGVYLRVQADQAHAFFAQLKRMPAVGSVAIKSSIQRNVQEALTRSFTFFSIVLVLAACVIIGGTVYNSARIALAERGNELASLSILGFTRSEVAWLLLGEQVLLVLAAIPVGLALGYALCASLVPLFDRDLFRLPLVFELKSFLLPGLAAIVASGLSSLLVVRRIQGLDLISVLKSRE